MSKRRGFFFVLLQLWRGSQNVCVGSPPTLLPIPSEYGAGESFSQVRPVDKSCGQPPVDKNLWITSEIVDKSLNLLNLPMFHVKHLLRVA